MASMLGRKEKRAVPTPTNVIIHIHSSNFDCGKEGEVMRTFSKIVRINDVKYEELDSSGIPHFRLFPSTVGKLSKLTDALTSHCINFARIVPA